MQFSHNTVAIVYDFDGTLTPKPMQEYTILPEIGISAGEVFWREVKAESIKSKGEEILTYMRLMIDKSHSAKYPVTRRTLQSLARNIQYFQGVRNYFDRINKFAKKYLRNIKLRHYIVSAGLKEIIEGTSIAKYFRTIFASEYFYDEYGAAKFPKVIVNDTLKTQFIFRINKGKEELHENINSHMPLDERPIPFENILYIGDGLTDVPCMTVIRKNGGFAIAVFNEESYNGLDVCKSLLLSERVDFIAPADFRAGKELDRLIKMLLVNISGSIKYGLASFEQGLKYLEE